MPILRILCYNGSLVTWTVVSMTTAKFKPLIYSVWFRLIVYRETCSFSCFFIWLLLVACTILLYNRIHTEGWKLCVNRGPVCTLELSRYIASARTAYKTSIVCYGHHVAASEPLPSKRACLQSRSLAKAVSAGFTILAFSRHATTSMILRTEREVCVRMLGLSEREVPAVQRGGLSVRLVTFSLPPSGREGHKARHFKAGYWGGEYLTTLSVARVHEGADKSLAS
jgi:hypothetical protein